MGETLAFLPWRLNSCYQLQVGKTLEADAKPSAIFRRAFAITTSGVFDPTPLAAAIATVGEDRLLFSVVCPCEDSSAAAAPIDNAPLSDASRAKICSGNARRMLRLWSRARLRLRPTKCGECLPRSCRSLPKSKKLKQLGAA